MNLPANAIEIHSAPSNLYDYRNKIRPQKAHVIIRKEHVGIGSNDLGFIQQPDGTYNAIIDEFSQNSRGYDQKWLNSLKQKYQEKVTLKNIKTTYKNRIRSVKSTKLENGKIKISVELSG